MSSLIRKSSLSTTISRRGVFQSIDWYKKFYNTCPEGGDYAKFETSPIRSQALGGLKDLEDQVINEERNVADVPKEAPGIAFDYYAARIPSEFAAEVKDSMSKWKEPEKQTYLESLLTPAGQKPKREFHNLISQATLQDSNARFVPKSGNAAYNAFDLVLAKKQSEVWAKRAKTYDGYADLKESQRTTMDTTPDDVMDREPWIRKEIQEEIDAGDWFADYDIKVPENPADFSEEWKLRIDPKHKEHQAEDNEIAELVKKFNALGKISFEEQQDAYKLKYTLTKPG